MRYWLTVFAVFIVGLIVNTAIMAVLNLDTTVTFVISLFAGMIWMLVSQIIAYAITDGE